jgi:hypothetical protein
MIERNNLKLVYIFLAIAIALFGFFVLMKIQKSKLTLDTNQVASPTPTPTTSPDETSESSEEALDKTYHFAWDSEVRLATVTKDSENIYQFKFDQQPVKAWYEPSKKIVLIVTKDPQQEDAAEDLFFYDGARLKKIYQGTRAEIGKNIFSGSRMDGVEFSPDEKYLYISEIVYEGSDSITVDLSSLKTLDKKNQLSLAGEIFWSPSGTCAFNHESSYGDMHTLSVAKNTSQGFLKWNEKKSKDYTVFSDLQVYWDKKECKGAAHFKAISVPGDEYDFDQKEMWVSFDYDKGFSLLKNAPDVSQLQESKAAPQVVRIY